MSNRYIHNKSGQYYMVIGTAINCTNAQDGQKMVLYRKVEFGEGRPVFAREEKEFHEKFTDYDEHIESTDET